MSDYLKERFSTAKIVRLTNNEGDVFFGATIQTTQEYFNCAKGQFNAYEKGKTQSCEVYKIFKGTNIQIDIVMETPCESNEELLKILDTYVENDICINKNKGRERKEYKGMLKEDKKQVELKNQQILKKLASKEREEKLEAIKKAHCASLNIPYEKIRYEEDYHY
jgi:hypothetical protein